MGGVKATAARELRDQGESSSDSAAGHPRCSDPAFSVSGARSPLTMPVAFPSALDCHMQDQKDLHKGPGGLRRWGLGWGK